MTPRPHCPSSFLDGSCSAPGDSSYRIAANHHFRIQIRLAFEIGVKAAVSQFCPRHDLSDGCAFESMAIEQPSCAVDDPFPGLLAMYGGIRHEGFQTQQENYALHSKYYLEHI